VRQIALWRCQGCGECCKQLTGKRFAMALTPQERVRLQYLAAKHNRSVNVQPLTRDVFGRVTLYQLVEECCPFLNTVNRCEIYSYRPLVCRAYPLHALGVGKCTALESLSKRGFTVQYPVNLKQEGMMMLMEIQPRIKSCSMRFNLNRGWEIPIVAPPRELDV